LQAVLMPTERMPETPVIKGHDFNKGNDLDSIMQSMFTTGFQVSMGSYLLTGLCA
jgi:hypothetical protein